MGWISTDFELLAGACPFKCMIVDWAADPAALNHFKKPHHLYNFSAMMAIWSALPWSFADYDRLTLSIFSEYTDRTPDDNFTSYAPRQVARRSASKRAGHRPKAPTVQLPIENVQLVPGDPQNAAAELAPHCEFVQLADLLTSAVAQAINASSSQGIKIDLARGSSRSGLRTQGSLLLAPGEGSSPAVFGIMLSIFVRRFL